MKEITKNEQPETRWEAWAQNEILSLKSVIHQLATTFDVNKQNSLFFKNQLDPQGVLQMNLIASWQALRGKNNIIQDLNQVGFRVFSQSNEDGILLYLFTMIGTTNKLFVEIGANTDDSHVGIPENNTTNLTVYHGWNGLIIDADKKAIDELIYFFARCKSTKHFHWNSRKSKREDEGNYFNPMIKQKLVTAENINEYFIENKVPPEIDLLSIDIDGMDYHLWKAIKITLPRVVIIEFNQRINFSKHHIPSEENELLNSVLNEEEKYLSGCSLISLVELAKNKNYRLVGISSSGFNAFFMRNDVGIEIFKEITEEQFKNYPLWHWTDEEDFLCPNNAETMTE